jgi:hypothetical protein
VDIEDLGVDFHVVKTLAARFGAGFSASGQANTQLLDGFCRIIAQVLDYDFSAQLENHSPSLPFFEHLLPLHIRLRRPKSFKGKNIIFGRVEIRLPSTGAQGLASFNFPFVSFLISLDDSKRRMSQLWGKLFSA